jgi:lysine 2,3-aminomutase
MTARHESAAGSLKRNHVTDIEKLPHLSQAERVRLRPVTDRFAFRATRYYLNLIDWTDPQDPIRRLIVPTPSELRQWGQLDPSRESAVTVAPGVQHKYTSTALILATPMCMGFCRYCFRKRLFMDGFREKETVNDFSEAIRYIAAHPEVSNVLVTGGDPMVLSTRRLGSLLRKLREIDHVRIIRLGTKTPAFNPYRFLDDERLFDVLSEHSHPDRRLYVICHFDHPRELTPQARMVINRLIRSGVICVNQTPISRGINDNAEVMAQLMNELSYMGVPQYYFFQCRPTMGNHPYAVPIVEGYFLVERAKTLCSGLAKRLRLVMSHESGKVEVAGVDRRHVYLKYHRAKEPGDDHRFVVCHRNDNAYWLDELRPVDGYSNPYFVRHQAHRDQTGFSCLPD